MTASPTLYQPGASFLHRLHPLTKLTFSLCALVVVFAGPGGWISAILPGLLALSFLWRAGLGGLAAGVAFRLLAWVAVIMFSIHGLFGPNNQTALFSLGPLEVGLEGIQFAFLLTMRLASMLFTSLVLVLTTHPSHLVQALTEAGLPNELAYLLGSPLLLLPQMMARAQAIRAVQQARGLETQGSLPQRIRALFPLVAPLVFSALVDVEERSLALEVRAFSAPTRKTFLNELTDTRPQRIARRGMIALAIVFFLLGIGWRLYASS
jgi:energy-coupling factor transport system permease protein